MSQQPPKMPITDFEWVSGGSKCFSAFSILFPVKFRTIFNTIIFQQRQFSNYNKHNIWSDSMLICSWTIQHFLDKHIISIHDQAPQRNSIRLLNLSTTICNLNVSLTNVCISRYNIFCKNLSIVGNIKRTREWRITWIERTKNKCDAN